MNELSKELERLEEAEQYFAAIKILEQLIEADPDILDLHYKLGMLCMKVGEVERAATAFRLCIEEYYEDTLVHLNLGHALKAMGRTAEAVECYQRLIDGENDARAASGYWSLADLKDYRFDRDAIDKLEARLKTLQAPPGYRGLMLFALGCALEQHSHYSEAYQALAEANDIVAMHRPFRGDYFGELVTSLVKETQTHPKVPQKFGATPIFIVGMPRSGTTLVEQILASHSMIESTDELPFLERIALDLDKSGGYAAALGKISAAQQETYAKQYLAMVEPYRKRNAAYFIDKNPNNFLHIGLIKALFPDARIINVVRDPLDNAMSVYKQYFYKGHEYSYSMQGIIYYWQGYLTLMMHWNKLYRGLVFSLGYEALVKKPEEAITAMLEYCGVPVEEQCFRFYESDRPVLTPSASQVRSPITDRAVGSGLKYQQFVAPFIPQFAQIRLKAREVLNI
jgi:tetratricopeptide (TPR) repeat protein